jgi:hypothetical protein
MLGPKVGEEAEKCKVNFHEAEFLSLVGGTADDGVGFPVKS